MAEWESVEPSREWGARHPSALRALGGLPHVVTETLAGTTAAQIIRTYGETEVQVNRLIPKRQRHTVARHTIATHADRCEIGSCLAAREWLRRARTLRLVATATA